MQDVAGEVRSLVREHPLKSVFRELGVRQVEVAAYCGISSSSAAHFLLGYRRPGPVVESKMQSLAAQVRRQREAEAQVVAGDGE